MTAKMNVSPTFVIGLGGTGALALQYVKRKILRRLKSYGFDRLPEPIPFIEYLVLDTIGQEDRLEEFVPDEFMDIGRLNISRVLDTLRSESDDKILKWFPPQLDPGQIDSGAGGVRSIGRLCFFMHESQIENRIKSKVGQITNASNIQNYLGEYLPSLEFKEANAIDVHFVSSLCGGTGSACLLDTAFLVQHLINEDTKLKPNCVAHLVTTEPFEGEPGVGRSSRDYVQNNFAVALSEIEHFTKRDAPAPWSVEYRNGTVVNFSERTKPFSLTYLLGYKDGVSLKRHQICEIIGETIALKTVHPDGKQIRGRIENHKPHVINTEDTQRKRRTYSSYNTQILRTDPDEDLLKVAVVDAGKAILHALCRDASDDDVTTALKDFEANVISQHLAVPKLELEHFHNQVKSSVGIDPGDFNNVARRFSTVFQESDGKRRKKSNSLGPKVFEACEVPESDIRGKHVAYLSHLSVAFKRLEEAADEAINNVLCAQGLNCAYLLLKQISKEIYDLKVEFRNHLTPRTERRWSDEIANVIAGGSIGDIARIASERAIGTYHRPILETLSRYIDRFETQIRTRLRWCQTARENLQDLNKLLPQKDSWVRFSHTTNSTWTQASLNQITKDKIDRFVRKFIDSLEREQSSSEEHSKVRFLPALDASEEKWKDLLFAAARDALEDEIESRQELMAESASESMHEFVELASPAWQIERMGEDIASVSLTSCPENSKAGRIMSRSGKDISFSKNGNNLRELILFRSEHGASVIQLSNLKRCMKAVSRKLHAEGKSKINEICLDPTWNIAAPLALSIEDLSFDFTVAIMLNLIEPGFRAYMFSNPNGPDVELRQNPDTRFATRRFEAFGSLLEMDCEDRQGSRDLRKAIESVIEERTKDKDSISSFRSELHGHMKDLHAKLELERDVRERWQMTREIESVTRFVTQLELTLSELERNHYAPPDQSGDRGSDRSVG